MNVNPASLAELGVKIPEISLPAASVNIEKWAVIACDQWTQDRDYWLDVANYVGDSPSTLRLIFPEVYLNDENIDERISAIHATMDSYIKNEYKTSSVLAPSRKAGVFVERTIKSGVRRGFIMALDLEKYDWKRNSTSIIRCTEDTIEERLPPRVKIRTKAPLEVPHILVLIDDKENLLMGLFEKLLHNAPIIYKSALMKDGGSVQGRLVYRQNDWNFISDTLNHLYRSSITKFGADNAFLFAVGDGNHSLAAAKTVWEQYKAENKNTPDFNNEHRARYALVEVVNLYDEMLKFEPIHRVLLKINAEDALAALQASGKFNISPQTDIKRLNQLVAEENAGKNRYAFISRFKLALLESEGSAAATVALEPVLQNILREKQSASLDYLHDADELCRISLSRDDAAGIILPPFKKDGLFETIAKNGPLPRKSFSMGAACEKRYYLECRKLFY
ncbi:MAG: DUF1015 domain-containing protein [Termitinemataceae bacterium]|nr:MAG: DUF1015 domain-containing protein [Termitinemataceae bacterium]